MIKGMYGKNKPDDGTNEVKSWAVGFDHSFSKHTKAYASRPRSMRGHHKPPLWRLEGLLVRHDLQLLSPAWIVR